VRKLVAGSVLVLVTLTVLWAMPASAATTAVGWWTRSPVASAPEGGVAVGNAPDGPLSVAAVGVDLGRGVSSATLTIEQTGGTAPPAGQLVACLIGGGFESAAGAPIEEAPATTCDGASVPVVANGTTWTANLREIVGDAQGAVGVAIVPATGSSALFDLQFDAPSFTSTPSSSSSSSSSGGTTATTMAPRESTATTTAPRPSSAPVTFAVPRPPTVAAPASTTTTLALDSSEAAAAASAVPNIDASSTFSGNAGGNEAEGRPIGQAVTMVLIAVIVGIAAGVAHRLYTARLAA